jgi:Sad1 / UNC-like C-terminal
MDFLSLQRRPPWLSKILFLLCSLLVHFYLSNIVRFTEQHIACILPSQITRFILQPGRQCDWHHTAFSSLVPFSYGRTSLNAGAVVTRTLTSSGIDSVHPSTVLNDATEACWSFRGSSGTFGIALDTPNIIPTHVAISHWPFNSTNSLSRAPRQVMVWGLVDGEANLKSFSQIQSSFTSAIAMVPRSLRNEGVFLPLAKIDFDITARSLRQVFPLQSRALSLGIGFGVIVFDIRSNWGASVTSLCSVRVYGHAL